MRIFLVLLLTSFSLFPLEKKDLMKQFYYGKKVLVTGGCGFIGSHVAQKLVNLGANVTILDDLSSGNIENIEPIKKSVTFIESSITDPKICLQATEHCDIIFHLAAFISVPQSVHEPRLCHEVNVDGTLNLLEAARINSVNKFIFSSSSAVYGANERLNKESQKCFPDSPYATSKLIGELYCQQYSKNFNLTTVMLRYFNVFGPRQNPHAQYAAVIAKFRHQMHHNLPITIFGDGMQTRDFISVHDVVMANLTLAMLEKEKINGQVFNIASGISVSILELSEQLKKDFPEYTAQILFAPPRPGDLKHSRADCTKLFQIQQHFEETVQQQPLAY